MLSHASTPPPAAPSERPSVADRVRTKRLELGLSQMKLAARAGLSLATVGLIERGGIITRATAAKITPVLGLEPEELLR